MPAPCAAPQTGLDRSTRRVSPAPLPLFLPLADGTYCRCNEVQREPGDEARRIVEIWQDGVKATAADCRTWHECDCPEGAATGNCLHLSALRMAGVFVKAAGWPEWDYSAGPEGGLR